MGWIQVLATKDSAFGPTGQFDYYYYVHSFAADDPDTDFVVATTDYGVTFPAVVIQDHVWGCQFHPEKSSNAGIAFLTSFVSFVQARVSTPETTVVG